MGVVGVIFWVGEQSGLFLLVGGDKWMSVEVYFWWGWMDLFYQWVEMFDGIFWLSGGEWIFIVGRGQSGWGG